ncbi:MAG: VanW family protein [Defluviitaleaceae bacterium]|nr:VanW family protein [Defluviitaleaceae bacterium]
MKKFFIVLAVALLFAGCAHQARDESRDEGGYPSEPANYPEATGNPTRSAPRDVPRDTPRNAPRAEQHIEPRLEPQIEPRLEPQIEQVEETAPEIHIPPERHTQPRPANSHETNERTSRNSRVGSDSRFAYYETKFELDDEGRTTNITLAARAINGTTVAPGEIFSFNETVGSTTAERGYKEAIVFRGGEKDKNFGGGVCQVSTTLCNAANAAGMKITERHDHSLPVQYVGNDLEAATSQNGNLDFKFKNEKNHPVTIRSGVENGVIWVTVEGA